MPSGAQPDTRGGGAHLGSRARTPWPNHVGVGVPLGYTCQARLPQEFLPSLALNFTKLPLVPDPNLVRHDIFLTFYIAALMNDLDQCPHPS